MLTKYISCFLVLLLLPAVFHSLNAQDVVFTASAKNNVREGEQFRLVYTVNGQGSGFSAPKFDGFRVLSGPNSSTNQSYSIVNGRVTQSYEVSYTYYLQATKPGEYKIPSAGIIVNGKKIQSNTLTINVIKSSQKATGGSASQSGNQQGINNDDVFIKAIIDKKNPFQGEQVIITYKIYTRLPISQISVEKLSSFPGFWYKDLLENNDRMQQHNEVINGEQYVVADMRKIALFPQRSGKIEIEPMQLNCLAQVKTQATQQRDPFFDSFFNDPFFSRNMRNVQLKLSSNSVKINVKPLPLNNKPADFNGAVGSYKLKTEVDRTSLKANEAINLQVTISGSGNIELIDELAFDFPPDFEVYDPKISNRINKRSSGISGTRTFEYLIIPRNAGDFRIKPSRFIYFDPKKRDYVRLTTPEFNFHVEKSDKSATTITYSGISQKDIQFIGSDIRHIKSYPFALTGINVFFFRSTLFYLLLLIPLTVFISTLVIWRYMARRKSNVRLMKNKKATRVARKSLKKANKYLKNNQSGEFYIEISRALWGYLSDKFNIPLSALSMESVSSHLKKTNVPEGTIMAFQEVLNNCEYARFAPGDSSLKMNEIYLQALSIISKIENELK